MLRWLAIVDLVGLPLLIALYIWRLQFTTPRTWIVFLAWLAASFVLHRDTPKTLGWRADNLGRATRNATVALGALAVVLLAIGFVLGAPRQLPPHFASWGHFWSYFAFCLLQQVALNSLLNNRLMELVPERWLSSLLAGVIFAALHWPNPVLVPATLIGGIMFAALFARERNIIPLAVVQAILGTMLWWAFPLAWHHRLRVGPGYYDPW